MFNNPSRKEKKNNGKFKIGRDELIPVVFAQREPAVCAFRVASCGCVIAYSGTYRSGKCPPNWQRTHQSPSLVGCDSRNENLIDEKLLMMTMKIRGSWYST